MAWRTGRKARQRCVQRRLWVTEFPFGFAVFSVCQPWETNLCSGSSFLQGGRAAERHDDATHPFLGDGVPIQISVRRAFGVQALGNEVVVGRESCSGSAGGWAAFLSPISVRSPFGFLSPISIRGVSVCKPVRTPTFVTLRPSSQCDGCSNRCTNIGFR